MNIAALTVRRWQITLVGFLLLAILGLNAFLSIPRSVDPHFPIETTIVTVQLPGADAAEMEETVARPIEDVLQGLDNVREITSSSSDGSAVIVVNFVYGTDAETALDRTVREVNAIRSRLPGGIAALNFRRPRTTEASILQLALVHDGSSWRRVEKYAGDLRDRLNVVPGVRATVISGLPEPEMRVALDPGKLAELRIPPALVASALANGGIDLPGGAVQSAGRRFNVDAGGAYRRPEDIAAIVLRAVDGRIVRVGDGATVGWAEAEQLHVTRFNGKPAVFVSVKQKDGIDASTLRQDLDAAVAAFRPQLPPDMRLETGFDQSRDIERRLGQLTTDFAIALALVLVTLLPLGTRASFVVMISIPLSLAIGVLVLFQLGYSLNQISISGFIISLGLLVDDSIVVVENIERHIRDGDPPEEAAINGTREIAMAVLGSTGVLLFAFLPLANLPEGSGDFVRGLPLAVLATVSASLLVSMTIVPFFASRILKGGHGPEGNRFLQALNGGIERFYRPILHWALDNPHRTFWGAMAACVAMFATVPLIGFSLFPKADQPYFMVRVEAPEGSSVVQTDRIVREVSGLVADFPGLIARMENAGRGNPQIFYNNIPREFDTRYGEIFVTIDEFDPRRTPDQIAALRRKLATYAGARVTVVQFDNGPPVEAPLALRITGPELGKIKALSADVAAIMRRTKGTRDVVDPLAVDRIDLDLGVDTDKAGLLNVPPDAVRRTLRLALSGERVAAFRDAEGDSYPVRVRLPLERELPVSTLGSIYVTSLDGASVPLSQLASPRLVSAPAQINRYKLQRANTVSAAVEDGMLPSKLLPQILTEVDKLPFPPGYSYSIGGEAEASARSSGGLGGVILLAGFGIFGVLVAEFGRFREVTVVAGVIPLGLFGGLFALLLTGYSLSFLAVIGFVALIGIEIKNSILLVDFTTQLRERGMELREAIERAGEIRFLPVLLTSVTAIGGLLPLALSGAPLYAPLAWVIIGGLISSTLLSRIVTPVMYLLLVRGRPIIKRDA
ncbi:MAG: efflux RND transporter permease subunit [Novosphingobium sp.]